MKLIKPGDGRKEPWQKELTCTGAGNGEHGCGAVLLVEQADLFKTGGGQDRSGADMDVFITFECSECHALTDLKDADHPYGVWTDLKFYMAWKAEQQANPRPQFVTMTLGTSGPERNTDEPK